MATLSNSPTFFPTQISSCSLWLDASDSNTVIRSGNNVTRWNDKSINSNNMISVVSPTYNSSEKSIVFTGTQYLSNSLSASTINESVFVVSKVNNIANCNTIFGGTNPSFGPRQFRFVTLSLNTTVSIQTIRQNLLNILVTSTPISTNTSFLGSFVNNGTTLTHYYNGISAGSSNSVAYSNSFTTLGRNGIATEYFNGSINEIVVYQNYTLTTLERQQVEGYLAWKWGLQSNLPTSHPFYYNQLIPNLVLPQPLPIPYQKTNVSVFSPREIPSCVIWLDAADTSTYTPTNNSVTTITNKGVNGGSITQTGTGTVLVNQLFQNNLTLFTLNSNGSSADLTSPTINLTSPIRSIFIIAKPGTSGNQLLLNNGNTIPNGGGPQFYLFNSQLQFNRLGAVILRTTVLNNFLDTFGLYNATNTVNDRGIYINGSSNSLNINTTTTFISGNTNFTFGDQGTTMHIGEAIIYDNSLTTSQRQQVEGYLAWKWGLQSNLPTTHPFYFNKGVPNLILPQQTPNIFQITNFSGFLPTQISNLLLWFDAADSSTISLSGTNVTQWRDKSTTSNNMSNINGTVSYSQTDGLGFSTASAGVLRTNNSISLASNTTVFILCRLTNNNSGLNYSISFSDIAGSVLQSDYTIRFNSGILNGAGTNLGNTNDFGRQNYYVNGNFNPTLTYNNTYSNYTIISAMNNNAITGTTRVQLSTTFFSRFFNGFIREVIVYNNVLSDLQRQQVEAYLAWKWRLQSNIPSFSPYVLFPPN